MNDVISNMAGVIAKLSPTRQAGMMSAAEVLLAFAVTALIYLTIFGVDDNFWNVMTLAFIVPWVICIPANLFVTRQRKQLIDMADKLQETQEELQRVNKDLQRRASIDGLTGLANREHFIKLFDERRMASENNILMIVDADHFKNINDGYGHPVGDKALILLSSVFKSILRKGDLVGRIGGEEFGVLLPNTSEAEGEIIGEMIRHEIENTLFEPQEGVPHRITVSIGLTGVSPFEQRALPMRNADSALFEAKRRGRNQCVLYTPGMREKPRPFYEAGNVQGPIPMRV
ncbi:MAG: GGDEF domain-containing protein [Parasphingorhabdus sp.]|uniref:GGDEF domain-containing protein n=1 Tax=Parasphingorhabdus sp. TaxID=2709688 RepID=UPI0032986400